MINLLDPHATWKQSDLQRVKGTYYGHAFTGQVVADRASTCNHCMLFTVKLDSPIKVWGEYRERLIVGGFPNREAFESLETV